ncbi:MAG: TonB-dependent receptor plug domain-containing protein [Vicinamibacterales bacterium]
MHTRLHRAPLAHLLAAALALAASSSASAQAPVPSAQTAAPTAGPTSSTEPLPPSVFRLGEIVNVGGTASGLPGVGGAVITKTEAWTFERATLDQAVNLAPGVSSTMDTNGRRNEADIFVRGFGRWQVPLMIDGVRVYLPADNRLDFGRFLTANIAAVQIQKGYASVLDGPGAMGGAINLVTATPTRALEIDGGISAGNRDDFGSSNGYVLLGTRRERFYLQTGAAYSNRDHWTLSNRYSPTAGSLQPAGDRIGSDTSDWSVNLKAGLTPNATDEYTLNFSKQSGEKGAPLNVFNNPPAPPNSFWRWPYWDVQNVSLLTHTQIGSSSYIRGKVYRNAFKNGLDAYDDATYTTQAANGRFTSPYDDQAYGAGAEFGSTPTKADTIKAAFSYRRDIHNEQQVSRPGNPALRSTEPNQRQSQYTWSIAAENTAHLSPRLDLVAGVSVEKYAITRAEDYSSARGLFQYPRGGADAVNGQGAVVWRYSTAAQLHASVSSRARFPVIFELYSTRFGTATPNPTLGPERATNVELGWKKNPSRPVHVEGAIFYSDVRDIIQTVVLPDSTTQAHNVGTGEFYGLEIAASAPLGARLTVGGNYTLVHRTIRDALQPNLRATGVPTHKAFVFTTWRALDRLRITPSLDLAGDRWSDVNPAPAFPYARLGAYTLLNLDATATLGGSYEVAAGLRNLLDDDYQLAWGYPQQGRTFYVKTRVRF